MAEGSDTKGEAGIRIPALPLDILLYSICAPAALSVMVMFRRRLGFRMVPLWGVFALFAGLFAWANIGFIIGALLSSSLVTVPLYIFAFAFLVLGVQMNRHEWREIRAGRVYYSYSRGISRLQPMLSGVSEEALQRYIEPLLCLTLGVVLFFILPWPLPLWLVWSGVALAVSEALVAAKRLTHVLDMMDSIAVSESQRAALSHFRPPDSAGGVAAMPGSPALPGSPGAAVEDLGLPTNHEADDIQRMLERRRKRADSGAA